MVVDAGFAASPPGGPAKGRADATLSCLGRVSLGLLRGRERSLRELLTYTLHAGGVEVRAQRPVAPAPSACMKQPHISHAHVAESDM